MDLQTEIMKIEECLQLNVIRVLFERLRAYIDTKSLFYIKGHSYLHEDKFYKHIQYIMCTCIHI